MPQKLKNGAAFTALVAQFVAFIDREHAEKALQETGEGISALAAYWRLEGVEVFWRMAGVPPEIVEIISTAMDRYAGLLDGAPEAQRAASVESQRAVCDGLQADRGQA